MDLMKQKGRLYGLNTPMSGLDYPEDVNSTTVPNSKKVYKDSFKDKLMEFVIEHSDEPLMSLDEFERLSGEWDPGRKTTSEWYVVLQRPVLQIAREDTQDS